MVVLTFILATSSFSLNVRAVLVLAGDAACGVFFLDCELFLIVGGGGLSLGGL
jgi:hypothetical protein